MKYAYQDEKLGYYVVDGRQYLNKIKALEDASSSNNVANWVFNDSVFNQANWEDTPTESLNYLYAQRARDLRSKYDYLVLNYSGGSDSQNILDTFINNKIRLDEILIRWPEKASKIIYKSISTSPIATNFHSEWELNMLPKLQSLAQLNPEIKVEFYDYSDGGDEFYNNDQWMYATNGSHLNPCAGFMYYLGLPKYKSMSEKGIKVGHIFGIDKPRVVLKGTEFYTYFLDILTGITHVTLDETFNEFNRVELFYWSPDSVKLLQKQTHTIMNFFKNNRSLLPLIDFENAKDVEARSKYEIIVRQLIYPTWDSKTFQVKKPSSVFYCEYDDWFMKRYADTKPMAIWQESLSFIEKNIKKDFITMKDNKMDNFVGIINSFYKLGNL